jgi:hypothetical protein
MRIVTTTFWLPKKGNSNEEYEDAAFPVEPVECQTDKFRCAVADGATETSFSGLWAKLLVTGYVDQLERSHLKKLWMDSVETKQLAWYAEQKAESGAYAALVGLTITCAKKGKAGGTWESEAIGDSCLFLVRDGKLIESFPLSESEQFNSNPFLLSSNLNDEETPEMFVTKSGAWQDGDSFYLLTDAIARWTCKREEEHGDAANWLAGLKEADQVAEFVDVQRGLMDSESRPLMRNDDVTLMRINVNSDQR